ncbi:MAG: hypothetical protein GY913_16695 [Proteobacteria bacterium]|nr:hypothetical protein [Pseudomonadota bacterium]MCP4918543.1 hypothetical protein [Pseudomonadota bacterium]
MLLLLACTGPSVPTDTVDSVADSVTDSPVDSDPRSEWERVAAQYGVLSTIAGTGVYDGKSVNGWDESYEGGSALDAELSRPHMTLADSAGNLYIADKDAHAVRKIDTDGIITTIAGTSVSGDDGDGPGQGNTMRLSSPNGIWVLDDGTVYIHDMGNDKIRRLDTDGEMTTLFDTTGSSTGRGLWVADDESLAYVSCGSTLRSWTPDGGVEKHAGGFSSLGNLVVDPDGLVVATDRSGHTVHRISEDGDKELIAGTGSARGGGDGELATETGLDEVRGIWFHELGGYFLATHSGGDIWYVDTDGIIHLFIEGDDEHSHSGDGENYDTPGLKISEPRSITMHDDGRLILTENDHGYIRIVDLAQ